MTLILQTSLFEETICTTIQDERCRQASTTTDWRHSVWSKNTEPRTFTRRRKTVKTRRLVEPFEPATITTLSRESRRRRRQVNGRKTNEKQRRIRRQIRRGIRPMNRPPTAVPWVGRWLRLRRQKPPARPPNGRRLPVLQPPGASQRHLVSASGTLFSLLTTWS